MRVHVALRAKSSGLGSARSSALSPALLVLALFFASSASAGTKLIEAVKRGDAAAVRALIAQKAPGNNVNAPDADGSTALHWAVQRDDVALVDMLLAAGADVKAATRYNITPLSLACTNGNARVVDRLLKAGADPNGASEEGQTALMTAVAHRQARRREAAARGAARTSTRSSPTRGRPR